MEGRIKWYNEKKKYGFITTEEHGDIFVYHKNIREFGHFGFQEDDLVSFDLKSTPQGKQAVNVRPVKAY